jgi:hypothetical protein
MGTGCEGLEMHTPGEISSDKEFEVFLDDPLEPLLIGSFDNFEAARTMMNQRASCVPGRYFVWSCFECEVMAQIETTSAMP